MNRESERAEYDMCQAVKEWEVEAHAEGLVYAVKELGGTIDTAVQQLMKLCNLKETEAQAWVKLYW